MRKIKLLLLVTFLVGCTPEVTTTYKDVIPEGLKDCSYYRFKETSGNSVHGWKCPHSNTTTSYKSGKYTYYTAFIEK